MTAQQVQYWQNSETIFRHALRVTKDNVVAHENLGKLWRNIGVLAKRPANSWQRCESTPARRRHTATSPAPWPPRGDSPPAIPEYRAALRIKPDSAEAHYNLGVALASQGKMSEAVQEFALARQFNPEHAEAHYNLGALLASQGKTADAIAEYREAVRLRPNWPLPLKGLAWILATNKDANFRNPGEAVPLAERLCSVTSYKRVDALDTLAAAYAEGRFREAVQSPKKQLRWRTPGNEGNSPRAFKSA